MLPGHDSSDIVCSVMDESIGEAKVIFLTNQEYDVFIPLVYNITTAPEQSILHRRPLPCTKYKQDQKNNRSIFRATEELQQSVNKYFRNKTDSISNQIKWVASFLIHTYPTYYL